MCDFVSKVADLSHCLDEASKEIKGTSLDQTNAEQFTENEFRTSRRHGHNRSRSNSAERAHSNLSILRGKESIFKKPELPLIKCLKPRRTPDYQINPHKWQKYSLADVDISDQTNKSAAYAFLKEIEEQRDAKCDADETSTQFKRIDFKKSTHFKCRGLDPEPDAGKPKLKGSKLVMPEYVVGQKPEKKRKHMRVQRTDEGGSTKIQLSHLLDEDADEQQ